MELEERVKRINKQIREIHIEIKLNSLDSIYITAVIAILSFLISSYFLGKYKNPYALIFALSCLVSLSSSLLLRVKTIYTDRDKVKARRDSDFLLVYSSI